MASVGCSFRKFRDEIRAAVKVEDVVVESSFRGVVEKNREIAVSAAAW